MPKVYISPSVQEHNSGVGNYGTEETRMNQIADVVCTLLKLNGFEVYRNNPNMSLGQIVADSNSKVISMLQSIVMQVEEGEQKSIIMLPQAKVRNLQNVFTGK